MSKIKREGDCRLMFKCPGCTGWHSIRHNAPSGVNWEFNEDYDKPTISPSILVTGTELTDKGRSDLASWQIAGYPKTDCAFETTPTICHSYITDGKIQFLSDCTHGLSGLTVDLPEISTDE